MLKTGRKIANYPCDMEKINSTGNKKFPIENYPCDMEKIQVILKIT